MAETKKRVCVIGGGLAGLTAVKQLLEEGVTDVVAYEMMPTLGGVYSHYTWAEGKLTSSGCFTWFSDFPMVDRKRHSTFTEICEYCDKYAEHFGLMKHFQMNVKITECTLDDKNEFWTVKGERGWFSNGHPSHPKKSDVKGFKEGTFTEKFTHLVVASGLHNVPKVPRVEGLDTFKGKAVHSSEFRSAEPFKGKRVVVVGGGESGSDITRQVAKVASKSWCSLRSCPGTLFPRRIEDCPADFRDNRLLYCLPHTQFFQKMMLKGHRQFYERVAQKDLPKHHSPEEFRLAGKMNFEGGRCVFNTNACKSFGIPEAIIRYGTSKVSTPTRIEGSTVYFADGEKAEDVDCIVWCTGYFFTCPFLDKTISDKVCDIKKMLWKNCVVPELGDKLFVSGFMRPQNITLFTTAEMTSRLMARVVSGNLGLPSQEKMREDIETDYQYHNKHFGSRAVGNAMVDWFYFMDGLATYIGCQPKMSTIFFSDPFLWLQMVFGAVNGAHYRLHGPGAKYELASKVIKETPHFPKWGEAVFRFIMTWIVFLFSTVVGLFVPEYRAIGVMDVWGTGPKVEPVQEAPSLCMIDTYESPDGKICCGPDASGEGAIGFCHLKGKKM